MKKFLIVLVAVAFLGFAQMASAVPIHGDTSGNQTYIDLTDNGLSDGEWADNVTTFSIFDPGGQSKSLQTNYPVGVSYFDSVSGTTVAVSKRTAMLTTYGGSVNSFMEVVVDTDRGYLSGYIWGIPHGAIPDFAVLMEDTNEDFVYAYFGGSGNLYTGLFGDAVFTTTGGNFFVADVPAALSEFFPPFDSAASEIIVSDFAYGNAVEEELPAVPEPAAIGVFGIVLLALRKRRA